MSERSLPDRALQLLISIPPGWSLGRVTFGSRGEAGGVAGEFLVHEDAGDFGTAVRAAINEWSTTRTGSDVPRNWRDALAEIPVELWFRHRLLPVTLPLAHALHLGYDEAFPIRPDAPAERFFSWLDHREANVRPSVAVPLRAAGYEVIHTGGGCLAWFRRISPDGADHLLITAENDIDGDPGAPEWCIGRYHENGWVNIDETFTLAEAIRNADLLPPPVNAAGQAVEELFPTVADARAALLGEEPGGG